MLVTQGWQFVVVLGVGVEMIKLQLAELYFVARQKCTLKKNHQEKSCFSQASVDYELRTL
jgi:hypothetical protein